MNDPDADSQPTPRIHTETSTGETLARPADVDTKPETQVVTEPDSDIRPVGDRVPATVVDTPIGSEPATESELGARIEVGEAKVGPGDDEEDRLLDLLARWEERYHRGDDASPESLGVNDPVLMEVLRERTERIRRLYAFLKHSPGNTIAESGLHRAGPVLDPAALARDAGAGMRDKTGSEPSPACIGRYRVIRVLGEGGFGRVYLAHDADLDRDVAIKMPIHAQASRFLDVETYLAEARIIARLCHPNIVPVYDVGRTEDDRCYVVSKYMDGGDLADRLRRGRPAFAESAGLIAVLCDALHYTHTHDLFHRDIKPANILLDAAGVPSLADFGLALRDEDLGKGARLVGTAAYMSPEQARGEGHRVDGRSDIFSLGLVLYELLTGRRPFRGSSKDQVMEQIIRAEPRPLRQIDDSIPRELERICLKALSKRAAERYATARDLAEDLRHFLESALWARSTEGVTPEATAASLATSIEPTPPPIPGSSDSVLRAIRIVPKGLSSFDENDADFFLDLLPGPRDRGGLPDGLRFWKTRVEATDPDKTFRVGLIYGPSGCGKSSLVKAGLLPLLGQHVAPVYVEATVAETEARLLRGVRKGFPGLPADAGLTASLTTLRRNQALTQNRKVLVVLDQFEQWLFAHRSEPSTDLVAALRQCDGEHLQAICLVRDDFWMAATRFMRDLEIDLVPDRNVAAVDLFDPKHARKVLAAFGRAYEALPQRTDDLTREHRAFLDQAVDGLVQDGRVVPVRLALLAEMVKRKPWTTATLRDVGGMDGVGVTFLEDTFSSPRSNPNHHYHQRAAQAVLKALLPEANADIKGRMRSVEELRQVSGYAERPTEFADLIRILDTDLRLITPVDPEGSIDEDAPALPVGGLYYQLTHDYLVHALREWLTRKQRDTRRGRVELLLAERAAAWSSKPEDRHLPSTGEWLSIRLLTKPKGWTEPQRRMMTRGRWVHGTRLFGFVIFIALVTMISEAYSVYSWTQVLLESLPNSKVEKIPEVLGQLATYPRWVYARRLQDLASRSGDDPRSRLWYSLARLPDDPGQVDFLHRRLLEGITGEMPILRESLRPYRVELIEKLWSDLREARVGDDGLLPVAGVLASYDRTNRNWSELANKVADAMVGAKLISVNTWIEALTGIQSVILDPLSRIYRDDHRPIEEREFAAYVLARYTANDPDRLVDLLLDSDPMSFSILFPVAEKNRAAVLADLEEAVLPSKVIEAPVSPTGVPGTSERPPASPEEVEEAKDRRAARAARAAVALIRLGSAGTVWNLLEYRSDSRTRSAFIHALVTHGVEAAVLAREFARLVRDAPMELARPSLAGGKNDYLFDPARSKSRALILALAGFPKVALDSDPRERDALLESLEDLYRNDPDAGIHSAAELILRRWGRQDRLKLEPGGAPRAGEPIVRRWYVNRAGQTMILIDGPVEFDMGAPPTDPLRQEEEVYHRERIPRRLAMASKEVSIEEFQTFARVVRKAPHKYTKRYDPDPDGPMVDITYFDAAAYCNWLSEREGLPPSYLATNDGKVAEGLRVDARAVAQGAYRLPTEAEWEYAARAGTVTSRHYGQSFDLLAVYAIDYSSGFRAHSCGMRLPNEFGLFDMLGNAMEWCHDRHTGWNRKDRPADGKGDVIADETVRKGEYRFLRGGSCRNDPDSLRSWSRFWLVPEGSRSDLGFRPVRTLP